jgi:ubiquinone/menaquinone biosynthesis C-methylase UbiE
MKRIQQTLALDEAWRKYDNIESRLTAPVSERMLDLAEIQPAMRVIDRATGRGEPALRAARRVGPLGSVLGLDISQPLLAIARERALREGISNIELRAANTESLDDVPDDTFDAATTRWGLMYIHSPVSTLTTACRVLRPGAVLVAAFWAEPERVPWATLPRRVLSRYRDLPSIDPNAPGAFRYADPSRIERDFAQGGFAIKHIEEVAVPVIEAATGAGIVAWVRDIGLGRLATDLPEDHQAAWEVELAHEVEQLRVGRMIRLGGVTRLVVGRSPQ